MERKSKSSKAPRIPFPAWQAQHKTKPGDTLSSSVWKYRRLIRAMDKFSVTVTEILPSGKFHNMNIIKSIPADTEIHRA